MNPSHVIIDNCVVSTFMNNQGISVTPIRALKKFGMKHLDIKSVPRMTTGSRKSDNTMLSMLVSADGMSYQQLLDRFDTYRHLVADHLNQSHAL